MNHLEAIVTGLFWWWVLARFLEAPLPFERPASPKATRTVETHYDAAGNEISSTEVETEYE
jgi:hypothetical protein